MTTESPPGHRGWRERLAGVSVRTRIAVSVAVLVAVALATSGVLVYVLEAQRQRDATYANVDQELAELAKLGQDQRLRTSQALLEAFLVRNVPDDDELFVGWWDGASQQASAHPLVTETTRDDPGFRGAVASLLPDGGSTTRDVPGIGRYLMTVQPVGTGADGGPDALVVVNYLDAQSAELRRTIQTYAVVSAVLLVLVAGAAWLQAGRLLRPLRALRENAEEISATDLSRRLEVASSDDIGQLTRTYNAMLDRVQQGFGAQRQFLDDAGHELRTPLTVLQGHLEVLDPGDPADVDETRALLLDEIERMSRLVDELILLAKSDRPDFVRPGPTSVAGLVELVHRKASALAADRTWTLGDLPPDEVSAELDEQRVTQALLQLCDNAVKHTTGGDQVTLAAHVDGRHVVLGVTDTGHGVAPEARERIFERFGRAEVLDGDEGFGLGLSIVRAIAEAHGGEALVDDGPGGGARFALRLPLQPVTPPQQEGTPWHAS